MGANLRGYLPARLSLAHSVHSGLAPLPLRRFSGSILLPVLQLVLLWWTGCLVECQGAFIGIARPRVYVDVREGHMRQSALCLTVAVAHHV